MGVTFCATLISSFIHCGFQMHQPLRSVSPGLAGWACLLGSLPVKKKWMRSSSWEISLRDRQKWMTQHACKWLINIRPRNLQEIDTEDIYECNVTSTLNIIYYCTKKDNSLWFWVSSLEWKEKEKKKSSPKFILQTLRHPSSTAVQIYNHDNH